MVLYSAEQMQFVVDALLSTPESWHIIPIAHIWYEPGENRDYDNPILRYNANLILPVFDKYNARESGIVTVSDNRETDVAISYNFSQAAGKIEFCMGGHLHRDYDGRSPGGIPIIICMSDGNPARDGDPAIVPGTTTEASVSVIVAEYGNNKVEVIRAGRGESRTVNLVVEPEEETPAEPGVNLLTLATDTSGNPFNGGAGYVNGKYVSGGAGEQVRWSNDASYWATGMIEWDTTKPLIIDGWSPDGENHSRWRCTSRGYSGTVGIENAVGNSIFNSIPAYSESAEMNDFYSRWKFTPDINKSDRFVVTPNNSELLAALEAVGNKIWFAISLPGSDPTLTITYA